MPDLAITTLHGLETVLRAGGHYRCIGETLVYDMWFQDGRFYLQSGPAAPVAYTTISTAVVALLLAIGVVEVQDNG